MITISAIGIFQIDHGFTVIPFRELCLYLSFYCAQDFFFFLFHFASFCQLLTMHVCAEVQSTGTGIITGMLFLGETQRCSSWLCGTLGGVVAERAPRVHRLQTSTVVSRSGLIPDLETFVPASFLFGSCWSSPHVPNSILTNLKNKRLW